MTDHSPALVLEQLVAGAPDDVFRAWTDPELLAEWWWPHLPGTTYEVEAAVGGAYRFRCDGVGIGVHGTFTAVEPPHRLGLTWVWEDGDADQPEERVEVEIRAVGDGSVVVIRHWVLDNAGEEAYRVGWSDALTRLVTRTGGSAAS
ncbi:hypothetical protein BH11ACT8_BH11ACT8_09990 [soil metagenome]